MYNELPRQVAARPGSTTNLDKRFVMQEQSISQDAIDAIAKQLPDDVDIDHCTITTGAEIAELQRAEADAVVVILPGYFARDRNDAADETHYPLADSAKEAAQELVDDSGIDAADGKTTWVNVEVNKTVIYQDRLGDIYELAIGSTYHTIAIDPDEPECIDEYTEHDWESPHELLGGLKENPGVQGHGGGVVITEVCAHCGMYRDTDTWAQNPENGEQGLTSVEYRDADDASLEWLPRQCQCCEYDGGGEACSGRAPRGEMVVVQYIPKVDRDTARAARNTDGLVAELRCMEDCADRLVEYDGPEWAWVEEAEDND
jgi:hypothetical protein